MTRPDKIASVRPHWCCCDNCCSGGDVGDEWSGVDGASGGLGYDGHVDGGGYSCGSGCHCVGYTSGDGYGGGNSSDAGCGFGNGNGFELVFLHTPMTAYWAATDRPHCGRVVKPSAGIVQEWPFVPVVCEHGLHACLSAADVHKYSNGQIWIVACSGWMRFYGDKLACTRREFMVQTVG
jgi:hypothetical protein